MKRTLLAVPLLGLAGWAGATMYAGQETQSAYDQLLEQLRVQHGLQVEPMAYEKNFLSSKVKTIVNGQTGSLSQTQDLPAPFQAITDRFVLVHEIEHGPVVLSNGLKALAGRIKTTIDMESIDPEFAQSWKQACACEEPLVLQSEITLQGEYSHVFDMQSLDWQDGDKKLSFGGIHSESRVDADKMAKSSGETGALSIHFDGGSVDVASGQWQMSGREAIKHIVVGDAVFKLPRIDFENEGNVTELTGIEFDLKSDLSDGKINSYVDMGIASLTAPNLGLNDTHFDVAVTGLPADKITSLTKGIATLDMSSNGEPIELLKLYRQFIAPGIGIRYGLRGKHAVDGEFDAAVALTYQPSTGITFDDLQTVGDLVSALQADASVTFDDALLTQLPNNAGQNPMLASVFSKAGDEYKLKASLLEGNAELNGNPFPLSMMFAQQMAQPLPSMEAVALAMQQQ